MQGTTLITRASFVRKVGLAGLFAASCLTPTWALAQQVATPLVASQPPVNSLGEIVVTARRHEERLQSVPISVVAINATQLDQQGVKNATDLSRVAPGLSFQSTAANRADTTFSIRGQGETYGQSSPGVVPYFADVANFSTAIYDLQNIQVLKGPQGTLFGRNTEGGAVLFMPQMPTDQYTGYISTRLGNYNRADLEFGIGGPLIADSDKLTFRIAGQSLNRQGFTTYQLDGSKLDNENRQSARAILTFKPVENFQNTTIVQFQRNHENGSGAVLTDVVNNTSPAEEAVVPLAQQTALAQQLAAQQALGIRTVLGNDPKHFVVRDLQGVINTTTWKINDFLTFKNIASYEATQTGQSYDLDGTNLTLLHVDNPVDKNYQLTEEFQAQFKAGPVSGVVGAYYEDIWSPHQTGYDIQEPSAGLGPLAAFGPIADISSAGSGDSKSEAVYAQADWKVTDKFTVTVGVRETSDPVSAGLQVTQLNIPLVPAPFGPVIVLQQTPSLSATFQAFTWNVAADYALNHDLNVYGTVRRGFKEGGFNGTALLASDKTFAPEFDTDYEVGIKGVHQFGDFRSRFDLDVFYDDYTNIQRFENIVALGVPQTVTKNAATGRIAGIDVDASVLFGEYFRISANYTYLDAKYGSYTDPLVGNVSNSRFPNTPDHQFTVTPLVNIPIPAQMGTLSAQANIYHQSRIATDPFNVPNGNLAVFEDSLGANVAGYTRVDLRVDWRHVFGSKVSLAAYVQNVGDKKYVVGTNNQLNAGTGTVADLYGEPRMFGIEARYEFGR